MADSVRGRFPATCALVGLAAVLLTACAGDAKQSAGSDAKSAAAAAATVASCRRGDTTAIYLAYLEFIKVTTPTAQRFLTAAGTDSAAPEDGFRAMQDKGPSYYYGGDSTAQRKIREKLESVGPYASLLIVQRGMVQSTAGDTVTVTLAGHFIGGEREGTVAASKSITVVCAASAWKVATVTGSAPQ